MKREYLNEIPVAMRSNNMVRQEIEEFYKMEFPILKITWEQGDTYKNLKSMYNVYYQAVKISKRPIKVKRINDSIYLIKQLQVDEKPSN